MCFARARSAAIAVPLSAFWTLPVARTIEVKLSCRSSSSSPESCDVFWMTLSISLACAR
jgi:hypothetical protein